MRALILAIALAVPSASLANDDLWPTFDTGWQYALTEPAGPGQERYGVVDAEPGPRATWTVRVECGIRDTRTGRVAWQMRQTDVMICTAGEDVSCGRVTYECPRSGCVGARFEHGLLTTIEQREYRVSP